MLRKQLHLAAKLSVLLGVLSASALSFSSCYNFPVTALFPRNFNKSFPLAVHGEGSWIFASDNQKYLDASGQAAVVNIGHGVQYVADAMAAQASQIAFAHTTQFHSAPAEKLATRLLALAPPNFANGRVHFTSGGSEATETAIKLARQFHLESGAHEKFRVVSRRQSYHGSTLGAMSVSGNVARRAPYKPLLQEWGHIAPCFCYHCPFEKTFPSCNVACADDLELFLASNDSTTVSAFIFEPVVGATLGAAAPPNGYAQRIAEICRKRDILLIADEIMNGIGRTGKPFAVQHWNIEPDLILVGKGISSGYAPLGAVLISSRVAEAFAKGSGAFQHGFTYQAHPVSTAAGNAVLDVLEKQNLFARVNEVSEQLRSALFPLATHPNVGEIRGLGLLLGVEFVKNKSTREPFPKEQHIAEKVRQAMLQKNVLSYPTQGCVDGQRGDHILLAPPFILTTDESQLIASAVQFALHQVFSST